MLSTHVFSLEKVEPSSQTWQKQRYYAVSREGIKYGPYQYPLFSMCRALLQEGTAKEEDKVQVGHTSCRAGWGATKQLTEGSKTALNITEYKEVELNELS